MIEAAVVPPDAARLAETVALDTAMADSVRRTRELGVSPYTPAQLLSVRPQIQIAWYEPDQRDGHPSISWALTNVGAGEARDVAVFLPGIASYDAGTLAVGESKDERRRFDD